MRVRYATSHPAAIARAVSSSPAIASGTLVATRVAPASSDSDSPSASSALPSASRPRAQRKGSHSSASSPASRTEAGASAARSTGTGGSTGTPSRSGRTSCRSSGNAGAGEQRAHRNERGPHPLDRPVPHEPVQALDERRAAGAETELEAAAGCSLQACRGHGDRARGAAPHGEHARGEADARGEPGDLREQDHRVVCPSLGAPEPAIARFLGSPRQPDRGFGVRVERRDADADPRAETLVAGGQAPTVTDRGQSSRARSRKRCEAKSRARSNGGCLYDVPRTSPPARRRSLPQ